MTDIIRPKRKYRLTVRNDDGKIARKTIAIDAGAEESQDDQAWDKARSFADSAVRDRLSADIHGDRHTVCIDLEDDEYDLGSEVREVDIEADVDACVREAGGNVDCQHEWSSEDEGGIDSNPGVWSLGGSTLVIREHCVHCGIVREETDYGPLHNPYQVNTTRYYLRSTDDDADEAYADG